MTSVMDAPENSHNCGEHLGRLLSRVGWGVLSLFVLFISGSALYVNYTDPEPSPDTATRISSGVVVEFLFGMFLFSFFGLIWAVAAPKWVERLWEKATREALLFLLLLVLTCVVYSLFGLI
jgi:hypothetical protein